MEVGQAVLIVYREQGIGEPRRTGLHESGCADQ